MGKSKGGRQSKNNVENRGKQTQYKIYDSQHCEKCSEHNDCKEYKDYVLKMERTGKGFGCVCKRGK
jgi:hypothetical protein